MLTTLFVLVALSFLIIVHEVGHFVVAKLFGLKIDEFGFGFGPRIFAWRPKKKNKETLQQVQGETEYSFNALPFGGFVRIAGENDQLKDADAPLAEPTTEERRRYFSFQPAWKRLLIVIAGVTVNFVVGWLLMSLVFFVGAPSAVIVGSVDANSPGAAAGFREGDIILRFSTVQDFINFTDLHRGELVTFEVGRGGKTISISVTPRLRTNPGEGAIGVRIGEGGTKPHGFFDALRHGFKESVQTAWATLVALYELLRLLVFRGALLPGVVGPIGIVSMATSVGQMGFVYLIQMLGLISVNLAVLNMIPFPALDGGRFFLILIEKLKGSPVPQKIEAAVNGAGILALLILIVLVSVRDITNLF